MRNEGRRDGRSCDSAGGFTLWELVAVVFIVSLLAALVFPSFLARRSRAVESDARRVASLLRYLNDGAVSGKQTYSLKVDLEKGTLSWKGPDGEKTEGFPNLAGIILQSRGEVKEGQVIVFFGPLGIQEGIAIRLKDEDKGMRVAFHPVSGRAKIIPDGK
jgi:general secretion pathway protein H